MIGSAVGAIVDPQRIEGPRLEPRGAPDRAGRRAADLRLRHVPVRRQRRMG